MAQSKEIQKKIAIEIGIAIAVDYYFLFSNPKNCGENFKWENWPQICESHAKTHIHLYFPHKIGQDIEDMAVWTARVCANQILDKTKRNH